MAPLTIREYDGPRADVRHSFELAEESPDELDRYLDAGVVLVAKDGDEVVGHVQLVDHDAETSEITNLAVAAPHRRRGIGARLVIAAVELARSTGRSRVILATATADIDNLRFYQRLGFRMERIERDVFTVEAGYPADLEADGLPVRDRVWFDRPIGTVPVSGGSGARR